MNTMTLLVGMTVSLALSGCAAIPLAALGASVFSSGAGAAVKSGTEYARGGVVYRTFSLPPDELRVAVGDTLARMEIAVVRDELHGDERRIDARAHDREIDLRLQPVTRTVTRLRLFVSEGQFGRDRATASEIVAQTERTVDERTAIQDARVAAALCHPRDVRRAEIRRASPPPRCPGWDGSRLRSTSRRAE